MSVLSGDWAASLVSTLVALNDSAWCISFSVFLLEGTRVGFRIRAVAPYACAALNGVAALSMLCGARGAAKSWPSRWRALVTSRAILSRGAAGGDSGWSRRSACLRSTRARQPLFIPPRRQSPLLRWRPSALPAISSPKLLLAGYRPATHRATPLGTLLTAGVAKGSLHRRRRAAHARDAVAQWYGTRVDLGHLDRGGGMAAAAFVGSVAGIVVTTAVLFTLLCPWAVIRGAISTAPRDRRPSTRRPRVRRIVVVGGRGFFRDGGGPPAKDRAAPLVASRRPGADLQLDPESANSI